MQRYRNGENLDEYEDDFIEYEDGEDRYEDDDEEEVEEEEEKEEPMSEEAIKYLELREKMKAKHRSLLRRENGKNGVNVNQSKLSNFGSFFGPSKPVIADRVIQESKSLLETRHLAPKVSNNHNDANHKVSTPSTSASNNGPRNNPPPRQAQSKAQIIKQTRDYSFLLSDDSEIPKSGKDPGPPRSSVAKPGYEGTRSTHVQAKRHESSSHSERNGYVGGEKRHESSSHSGRNGYVGGEKRHESSSHSGRNGYVGGEKRHESSSHSGKNGYVGGEKRKPSSGTSQAHDARSAPPSKSTSGNKASLPSDSRRQLDLRKQSQPSRQAGSSNGSGSRPAVQKSLPPKKPLPSSERKMPASSMERKPSSTPSGNRPSVVAKSSTLDRQRLPTVKPQVSSVNNRVDNRRDVQRSTDNRMLKKENGVGSKHQMVKQQPKQSLQNGHNIKKQNPAGQLRNSSAAFNREQKIKKRKSPDPDESTFDFRSEIRRMFGRPLEYHDNFDDDDDDLEVADFDTLMAEESKSARIAKKEDEIEWAKIQEEERQEALRKKAKKRRMNQR